MPEQGGWTLSAVESAALSVTHAPATLRTDAPSPDLTRRIQADMEVRVGVNTPPANPAELERLAGLMSDIALQMRRSDEQLRTLRQAWERLAEQRNRIERELQERQYTERQAARARREQAARDNVDNVRLLDEKLLLTYLTPAQKRTWKKNAYFDVTSNRGHRWRILGDHGPVGNVRKMVGKRGDDFWVAYCAHPHSEVLSSAGMVLAQALMLEADEEKFIKIGNRYSVGNYSGPKAEPAYCAKEVRYIRTDTGHDAQVEIYDNDDDDDEE